MFVSRFASAHASTCAAGCAAASARRSKPWFTCARTQAASRACAMPRAALPAARHGGIGVDPEHEFDAWLRQQLRHDSDLAVATAERARASRECRRVRTAARAAAAQGYAPVVSGRHGDVAENAEGVAVLRGPGRVDRGGVRSVAGDLVCSAAASAEREGRSGRRFSVRGGARARPCTVWRACDLRDDDDAPRGTRGCAGARLRRRRGWLRAGDGFGACRRSGRTNSWLSSTRQQSSAREHGSAGGE